MSSENFRLDRFEELFDRLEILVKEPNPHPEKIATISLLALINDQLAFLRNQHETGRLPADSDQACMRLLESSFVYGYLVGGGGYVGKVVEDDLGGSIALNAMREAFAELYREHGERNWDSSRAVAEGDPEFTTGFEAGAEDLRRFLSRLQGEDLGPTGAMVSFIGERLNAMDQSGALTPEDEAGHAPCVLSDGSNTFTFDDEELDEILNAAESAVSAPDIDADELEDVVRNATIKAGRCQDDYLKSVLNKLYSKYATHAPESSRMNLYRHVADNVEDGSATCEALRVFLTNDSSPAIVSTAALDYSVFHPVFDSRMMTGPEIVLEIFQTNNVKCRAGLFKGLLLLGDDRVCELLRSERRSLSNDEARIVCAPGSGYIFDAMVNFLIDWLEDAERTVDESLYGLVAAALGNLPRGAVMPTVVSGRRKFPVDPGGEIFEERFRNIPIDEYAKTIEPRLQKIARREPPPQVMPLVLRAWGLAR